MANLSQALPTWWRNRVLLTRPWHKPRLIAHATIWSACSLGIACLFGPNSIAAEQGSAAPKAERGSILVLGDSLAAGYGLEPAQAFPALLQEKIDRADLPFEIINAGLSGDTSAGGRRRLDWLLKRKVDVLVLELGGNDGLRGLSPETTKTNLQAIIDRTQAKYPKVKILIAGMQMPANMGPEYVKGFRQIFFDLARTNHAALIPFLLEGVGGRSELNLPDRIHPTAEGQKIVAENVWKVLKPLLHAAESDAPRQGNEHG
ncbi:MAG: arylesterase [Verrucomicrobiales bacterium]|nr:arylesterase [Verrucomicrobiales bacterium]